MPNLALHRRQFLSIGLILLSAVYLSAAAQPNRFEKEISRFETRDAESPPSAHPILFVGSSSIRLWDLAESFPGVDLLNRGFGGSKIADSVYFCDRIITKYQPRLIVFYAGDNDIASGMSPEQVRDDFQALVNKIRASLPETKLVYISIKPSIQRWKLVDQGRKANRLIKELCDADPLLEFVDVEPVMLGADGQPRKELFVKDGLHLSKQGYAEWTKLVTPYLPQ
jgi:lysophospholipase L1-like esterase